MIFNLFLFLTFFVIGRPQELFRFLMPLRPALVLTLVLVVLILSQNGVGEIRGILKSSQAKKYGYFFLVMIIGIPFAYHRRVAFDEVFTKYLANVLFFYIALIELRSYADFKRFFTVILFSVAFLSFNSLVFGNFLRGRFEMEGSMFDPNDMAYVLISLLPISIYFIVSKSGFLKKVIALSALIFSLIVILLSGLRGGIIGMGALLITFIFIKNRAIKPSYKIAFLAIMVIVAVIYSGAIDTERYLTITNLASDYNMTDEFGRVQIWKRGVHLLLTHPLTGVGVNCFPNAMGYLRESLGLIPKWQSPHNSYVQVAAETGFVGFFLFFSLILGSLRRFFVLRRAGGLPYDLDIISALMLGGFVGHLVAAFFLTQAYSIFFTLFFIFAFILDRLAMEAEASAPGVDGAASKVHSAPQST